jgi:IPT/TIG domain
VGEQHTGGVCHTSGCGSSGWFLEANISSLFSYDGIPPHPTPSPLSSPQHHFINLLLAPTLIVLDPNHGSKGDQVEVQGENFGDNANSIDLWFGYIQVSFSLTQPHTLLYFTVPSQYEVVMDAVDVQLVVAGQTSNELYHIEFCFELGLVLVL